MKYEDQKYNPDGEISKGEFEQMVNYLEKLLTAQIEKLRSYNLESSLRFAEQAGVVSQQIAKTGLLEKPEFASHKERIENIYRELELVIATEQDNVSNKLRQVRKGLKTLGAYGQGH